MKKLALGIAGLLLASLASYATPRGLHLSVNGGFLSVGDLSAPYGGASIGYSGGKDLSWRLKGLFYFRGGGIEIKGGVRKYFGTGRPTGFFAEGGLGYLTVRDVDFSIGVPILYGNLGYRAGTRMFVEASAGIDIFIAVAVLKAEIGVGMSF